MNKKIRLIPLIPLIIFLLSILFILFSPIKVIPCETSTVDPATSWTKDSCAGYYLTINQISSTNNINNSGLVLNLVLLLCGSFTFNGILFLLLFIFVVIKESKKGNYAVEENIEQEEDQAMEEAPRIKRNFSLKEIFGKKKQIKQTDEPVIPKERFSFKKLFKKEETPVATEDLN